MHLSDYLENNLPKFELPKFEFNLPEIKIREVDLSEILAETDVPKILKEVKIVKDKADKKSTCTII